jgi:hypothetical protein
VTISGRLQRLARKGVILISLAGLTSACTWFLVTLNPTPLPPSPDLRRAVTPAADPPPSAAAPATTPGAFPTAAPGASATAPSSTPGVDIVLDEVEHQISALRGLHPLEPIRRVPLPPALLLDLQRGLLMDSGFADRMAGLTFSRRLLGLPDVSASSPSEALLRAYYQRGAGEAQIAFSDSAGLDSELLLAYIQAYLSALLDQHFQALRTPTDSRLDLLDSDGQLALRALIEGDTALVQEQWVRIYGEALLRSFDGAEPTPVCREENSVSDGIAFVCRYGLPFVRGLYLDGGWAAVDAAYQTPPASTEALLHPERAAGTTILPVTLPTLAVPQTDWKPVVETTLGEWRLREMLEAYLPERSALLASEGWGGDRLRVYFDPGPGVGGLLLVINWDTPYDAGEHMQFFQDYLEARFGPPVPLGDDLGWRQGDLISLARRSAERTAWALTSDLGTGQDWLAALGFAGGLP